MQKINSVSCIIPAYNASFFLGKCVESIIYSGFEDLEIIIVDDGSTDSTVDEAKKLEIKYPQLVKLFCQENQGVSVARNMGLSQATKKWVMFVDADDLLVPNWVDYFDATDIDSCDMICFSFLKVGLGEKNVNTACMYYQIQSVVELTKKKKEQYMKTVLGFCGDSADNRIPYRNSFAKIFKRKILAKEDISFPVGVKNGEDLLFMLNCFERLDRVGFCYMPIYIYIVNPNSLTQRYKPDIREITEKFFEYLKPIIYRYPCLEQGYTASLCNNFFLEMGSFLFHRENELSFKEKKKYFINRLPYYIESIRKTSIDGISLFKYIEIKVIKLHLYSLSFYLWIIRSKIRDLLR